MERAALWTRCPGRTPGNRISPREHPEKDRTQPWRGIVGRSGSPQQRRPTLRTDRLERALTGGNDETDRHHGRYRSDACGFCKCRQRHGGDDPATSLVAMPQNRQCHRTPNGKQRRPSNRANESLPGANGPPARLTGLSISTIAAAAGHRSAAEDTANTTDLGCSFLRCPTSSPCIA